MIKWVNKQQGSCSFLFIRFFILLGLILSFTPDNSMANATNNKEQGKSRIQQILLTKNMIISANDMCSDYSAEILVDEQQTSPNSDLQPVSETWQPFTSSTADRCDIYFDLGDYYDLKQIQLHNVYNATGLEISAGEPGAWTFVTASKESDFNTWTKYDLAINTRYLKLSMQKQNAASINEILLFGSNENINQNTEKSAGVFGLTEFDPSEVNFPDNSLTINYDDGNNSLKINISPELGYNFAIDIYNLNGCKVYSKEYINLISAKLLIDLSDECNRPGVYIMHYYNDLGISKTVKFLKKR